MTDSCVEQIQTEEQSPDATTIRKGAGLHLGAWADTAAWPMMTICKDRELALNLVVCTLILA